MRSIYLIAGAVLLFSMTALGQETPPVIGDPASFEWLGAVVTFLSAVPYIGPVIVAVLKWVGLIASIATALSVLAQAILVIPEIVAKWAGATEVSAQIKKYSDLILPYLKYLSIFNVQKKP